MSASSSPDPVGAPRRALAVVGAEGRIGHLVMGMADARWRPLAVTRELDPAGLARPVRANRLPILVCTRNRDLDDVVASVHPSRHRDLVFVQNGMVQPWLQERGLGECTQGVLWVAVPRRGDPPVPGGTSVFHGPWAGAIARLLGEHGVAAAAVDSVAYQREVAVKLAWICIFGVLGSATKLRVGDLARDHAADVAALAQELHPLLAREPGLDLDAAQLVDRLQAYSARIPDFPSSMKEWRWRNGWQIDAARRHGVETPCFSEWLAKAGGPPT
jgi:ketopantoate reductase